MTQASTYTYMQNTKEVSLSEQVIDHLMTFNEDKYNHF